MASVAQNGGAIRDAGDLIHAMRDVKDRHAFGFQSAQKGEKLLDLAAR